MASPALSAETAPSEHHDRDARSLRWTPTVGEHPHFADWNIGGTLNIPEWFSLDLRYYDSDLHSAGNLADDRFVVKISRAF